MARIHGSNGADFLFGTDENDQLYGYGSADFLFGGSWNDYLSGGAGNDYLYGGDGYDTICGGSGKDTMSSGSNKHETDTFLFNVGDSGTTTATADVITDLSRFDHISGGLWVDIGPKAAHISNGVNSIEEAMAYTRLYERLDGENHNLAVMWLNPAENRSYLLMDIDSNGSYETGLILENFSTNDHAFANYLLNEIIVF